jgi:hypothetical protein
MFMGSSLVRLLSLIRARSPLKIRIRTMASARVCQGTRVDWKLRGERTVIAGSEEDPRLLGRDNGVTRDEFGEDTAGSLDTESKKADVDEEDSSLPASPEMRMTAPCATASSWCSLPPKNP